MNLGMGKILEIVLAAIPREEDVVLPPENDGLRLLPSEECLPLRVELHVRPVVVEEVELDSPRVRPIEVVQIHIPVIRADKLRSGMAVGVD